MTTPSQTDEIDRFERWSGTYEQSWLQPLFFDRVHQALLALIAADTVPESLVDVGCGTGRFLRLARTRWPRAQLIGVDPAEGMIAVARQLTLGATFHVAPAESLPLSAASVEVVVSTASFHHWRDALAGLREVARVLRPSGSLFLVDPVLPRWATRLMPPGGANRAHDPAALVNLFAQAGLPVRRQRRLWFPPTMLVTIGVRPGAS